MTLPSYAPQLFEPLTFEEFAYVFGLTEEDIKEIESIELLKNWINRAIQGANELPAQCHRYSYKIKDERSNVEFYRHFARVLQCVRKPEDFDYTGVTERLAGRFVDWFRRTHCGGR